MSNTSKILNLKLKISSFKRSISGYKRRIADLEKANEDLRNQVDYLEFGPSDEDRW